MIDNERIDIEEYIKENTAEQRKELRRDLYPIQNHKKRPP